MYLQYYVIFDYTNNLNYMIIYAFMIIFYIIILYDSYNMTDLLSSLNITDPVSN